MIDVNVESLNPGGAVIIKPGGKTPVDGVVVGIENIINEATLTCEPMAMTKRPEALSLVAPSMARDPWWPRSKS